MYLLGKEEAASKYLMFAELVELALICLISLSVFLLTFLSNSSSKSASSTTKNYGLIFLLCPLKVFTEFIKA